LGRDAKNGNRALERRLPSFKAGGRPGYPEAIRNEKGKDETMKAPNKNACAMINAIKAEWLAAGKDERHPTTSNAVAIFRKSMNPRLSEKQILELFELVFAAYLDVTGAQTEYSNN
jgi:hypothetical protein